MDFDVGLESKQKNADDEYIKKKVDDAINTPQTQTVT